MNSAERIGPGRVAPLLMAAAFVGALLFLRAELARGIADPPPLAYGDAPGAAIPDVRDTGGAARPGANPGVGAEDEPDLGGWVALRAETPDGAPAAWRQAGVRIRGEAGRRLGFTDESGSARFELAPELRKARDDGILEAFVRDPGRPDTAALVRREFPETKLVVPAGAAARLLLQDAAGRLVPDRTQVLVSVGAAPRSEALAYSVADGSGIVAGLPYDVPVRFVATPYGLPPVERTAWFRAESAAAGARAAAPDPEPVSFPVEAPAAEIVGVGFPPGTAWRIVATAGDGASPPFAVFVDVDERGAFRAPVPAGVDVLIEARPAGRAGAAALWAAPRLASKKAAEIVAPPAGAALVAGRVRLPDGRPAAGAIVSFASIAEGAADTPAPCAIADEEGAFRLRAPAAPEKFRPRARFVDPSDGAVFVASGAPRTAADGAAELRLDEGGEIAGVLQGVPRDFLGGGGGPSVSLVVEDAAGSVVGYGLPALDGSFSVRAPAGRVRVSLLLPGVAPIAVDGVDVPKGGAADDSRLDPLSPPRAFETAVVRVERADLPPDSDARLSGAVVTALFPDESPREPLAAVTESLGIARLPFEAGSAPKFVASFSGGDPRRGDFAFRPAAVSGAGALVVRLRPGAVVTFAGGETFPDPPSDATAQFVLLRVSAPDVVAAAAPRTLRRAWRKSAGAPRFDSVPDGVWKAKLEVVREGAARGAATWDLGTFTVRSEDRDVLAPASAEIVRRALAGG